MESTLSRARGELSFTNTESSDALTTHLCNIRNLTCPMNAADVLIWFNFLLFCSLRAAFKFLVARFSLEL
jgi:hypothetical protein